MSTESNEWLHSVLWCQYFMPISCHFYDCKSAYGHYLYKQCTCTVMFSILRRTFLTCSSAHLYLHYKMTLLYSVLTNISLEITRIYISLPATTLMNLDLLPLQWHVLQSFLLGLQLIKVGSFFGSVYTVSLRHSVGHIKPSLVILQLLLCPVKAEKMQVSGLCIYRSHQRHRNCL